MENLGIKATCYDFLGYLSQGVFFLIIVKISLSQPESLGSYFYEIAREVKALYPAAIAIFLGGSYILGHPLSTISSLLFEKNLVLRVPHLRDGLRVESLLTHDMYQYFKRKFKDIFDSEFSENDFRACICYTEAYQPQIYSTALVFLTFYGMSRTLAFSCLAGFLWVTAKMLILKAYVMLSLCLLLLLATVVLFYEYYRFFKYFKSEIAFGFVVPQKPNC